MEINISKIENNAQPKKTWATPTVDVIGKDQIKSGTNHLNTESSPAVTWWAPAS